MYSRGFNPPVTTRFWRDRVLPHSIIPLFWLYWVALTPARILGAAARRRNRERTPVVAIESGVIGWTHVYFEELFGSAGDYFGQANLRKQAINRDLPYFPQFRAHQERDAPTVVVLDVRTPGQSWPHSLRESFRVAWYLTRLGITPLVVLTDAFYRRHRWQSAVITAFHGGVVTFAQQNVISGIFPHSRIRGPLFMPISRTRLNQLREHKMHFNETRSPQSPLVIQFIGSMYPPREQFLQVVQRQLADVGIHLTINGDKAGTSNDDYWRVLVESDIIVTTTLQGPPRNFMDWIWVRQAVFRYAETMAAGTALVAQCVEGGFPFFLDGRDYLEFEGVDQAVTAISALANDPELRTRLAAQGHATESEYVEKSQFWLELQEFLR